MAGGFRRTPVDRVKGWSLRWTNGHCRRLSIWCGDPAQGTFVRHPDRCPPLDAPALVRELFLSIRLLSGYALPELPPDVHFVPLETMQKMICKGACRVRAFYLPGQGVYIDETIDVQNDTYSRSILLHELVHHLQHASGKFDTLPTACERWQAKEIEAYEIQHKYLKRLHATRSFIALDTVPITCPIADTAPASAAP